MTVTEPLRSTDSPPATRRRPSQARSQERFDRIVEAASELIAERGLAPVTMTDIATRAGMGLPALYRYFPNKTAVIRELAVLQLEAANDLGSALGPMTGTTVQDRIRAGIRAYCQHLNDPVRLQIRAAIHADTDLSLLDLEDSRQNAARIAAEVDHDGLGIGRIELERRALLIIELLDGVVRLASRLDTDEAEVAINTYAEIATWTMLRPEPFKELS